MSRSVHASAETIATFASSLPAKIALFDKVAKELPAVIIIHNFNSMAVEYMSPRGLAYLGLSLPELQNLGPEYHYKYFNPQDVQDYLPKITSLLQRNDDDFIITYFQQVRPSENHAWSWHLSTSKIFMRDAEGKPSHLITYACPIDPMQHITAKVTRLLEENEFLRKNRVVFASLTRREIEILRLMALGKNSQEMADLLHISEKTAATHRRNIKLKLNASSNYDITQFAQAFDLI